MATSAFKSTTKRTPVAGTPSNTDDSASSSKPHRRSRSLSRFSRRLTELDSDVPHGPAPKGEFVNTVRGSGFPDISLDDLAIEFFPLKDSVERQSNSSRSSRRDSEICAPTASSQRRGRSVSRQNSRVSDASRGVYNGTAGGAQAVPDANSSRRRSVSVSRYHIRDTIGNDRVNNGTTGGGGGGGSARAVPDANSRRRRSVSVARHHISGSDGNGHGDHGSTGGAGVGGNAWAVPDANSRRRRSVSVARHHISDSDGNGHADHGSTGGAGVGGNARAVPDPNSRRRRSVSVARHHISDSESDIDRSQSTHSKRSLSRGNGQITSLQKATALSPRRLGRSLSHTDLLRSHDGYSSQSSVVTDDESRDAHYVEKTIRAVYAPKKIDHPTEDGVNSGLYEKMRKELRSAVDEIRTELEQAIVKKPSALTSHDRLLSDNFDDFDAVSAIRKKYATKVKQSDQRKQDLLAAMALEEQRSKELSKIVRELLPDSKSSAVARKTPQTRKMSNDRNKMSKRLNEEAEKYFEDFISNVEDTDFSSFDGERSDASSSLGGIAKPRDGLGNYSSPAGCNSLPVEMEGVNLPWLKWETNNDGSPLSSKDKTQLHVTPKTLLWDAAQDASLMQDPSNHSTSSLGSWSQGLFNSHLTNTGEDKSSKSREIGNTRGSGFDMDEYVKLKRNEDVLYESWRERNRISSGGLLFCSSIL